MNSPTKYYLTIDLPYEAQLVAKLQCFDSRDYLVFEGNANRQIELPQGLYTVRLSVNGNFTDKNVLLIKHTVVKFDTPQIYSSALFDKFNGYATSHEYYTGPAIAYSKSTTVKNTVERKDLNSSLFIFLRYPSYEYFKQLKEKKPIGGNYKLFDKDINLVADFGKPQIIVEDLNDGWVAFNLDLEPGCYFLSYEGEDPRQLPLYVFENWHTQVFMTVRPKPAFGTLRVFFSKGKEFNIHDEQARISDILLDKIQNENYDLTEDLVMNVAYEKFDHPELAILCAYAYYKSKNEQKNDLFNLILNNLKTKILKNDNAPDIKALALLREIHLGENLTFFTLNEPPMWRCGYRVLIEASKQNAAFIPEYSINDFISENLFYDSPWTTFSPILEQYKSSKAFSTKPISTIKFLGQTLYDNFLKEKFDILTLKDVKTFCDNQGISGMFEESTLSNNWVANSIVSFYEKNPDIKINELPSKLNISGNTINRTIKNIISDSLPNF
jgi:hypothetical protein